MTPTQSLPTSKSVIDMWMGEQIRHRRQQLGLSLTNVAQVSGISIALLSLIERGQRSLSINNMKKLCFVLNIPEKELIDIFRAHPESSHGIVEKRTQHRHINLSDRGIFKENLTPLDCKGLEMYRVEIQPGGTTGDNFFRTRKGWQLGYIVAGTLELNINNQILMIETGDSFTYSSELPRKWRNPGQEITIVHWSLTKEE